MKPKLTFSGHQTFALRHGWLPKAVQAIETDPTSLQSEKAMLYLGVGKNMVLSIHYWLQATGIAKKEHAVFQLTELGERFLADGGIDQYLEDSGTLWLLHWQLASTPEYSSTWYWLFNYLRKAEFKMSMVMKGIELWLKDVEQPVLALGTLSRDIDCCLRCYITSPGRRSSEDSLECPLNELDLILDLEIINGERWYRFNPNASKHVPAWVVAYAILDYWERTNPLGDVLSFDDVAFRVGSPGLVFKMGPDTLLEYVDGFVDKKVFGFDDSNGIRNLTRRTTGSKRTSLQIALALEGLTSK